MLKAIKECMKNWLVAHERLYWYIVVGLAVLGFGIVTALGFAKLERAEAATTSDGIYYPDLWELNLGDYEDDVLALVGSRYYAVITGGNGTYTYVFDNSNPFKFYNGNLLRVGFSADTDGQRNTASWFEVDASGNVVNFKRNSSSNLGWVQTGGLVGTNFTLIKYGSTTDAQLQSAPQNNLTLTMIEPAKYSTDAPYVLFDSFGHDNKIAQGDTKAKLFDDIYEDYTTVSKWLYAGKIVNMSSDDLAYNLQLDVTVELPNDSMILQLAEAADVDLSWERNALNYTPDFVKAWYVYNGSDYSTYKIKIDVPVVVNERGEFEFMFTFPETEYLLMGDDNFRQRFMVYNGEDNSYWKAILLSYLHIDMVTAVVETTRSDSVVYGKVHSVRFERGYGRFTTATTAVDKNFVAPGLLDSMVNSDLNVAEREHLNELENRLDEMQSQIDSMNNFEAAFGGNLEGTDLWTGFGSLSKGVSSLGPSISNISALTGQVFGFLPGPISSIMYFTLFAVCIIAIIKAIRG